MTSVFENEVVEPQTRPRTGLVAAAILVAAVICVVPARAEQTSIVMSWVIDRPATTSKDRFYRSGKKKIPITWASDCQDKFVLQSIAYRDAQPTAADRAIYSMVKPAYYRVTIVKIGAGPVSPPTMETYDNGNFKHSWWLGNRRKIKPGPWRTKGYVIREIFPTATHPDYLSRIVFRCERD